MKGGAQFFMVRHLGGIGMPRRYGVMSLAEIERAGWVELCSGPYPSRKQTRADLERLLATKELVGVIHEDLRRKMFRRKLAVIQTRKKKVR